MTSEKFTECKDDENYRLKDDLFDDNHCDDFIPENKFDYFDPGYCYPISPPLSYWNCYYPVQLPPYWNYNYNFFPNNFELDKNSKIFDTSTQHTVYNNKINNQNSDNGSIKKHKKNPKYHLNKALYYYYNQNPKFNPYLKSCAYKSGKPYYDYNESYYDQVPSFYYNICNKISKNKYNAPITKSNHS